MHINNIGIDTTGKNASVTVKRARVVLDTIEGRKAQPTQLPAQ